ncbi:MAG TPA: hypothetical protein VKA49_23425 [Flavitalea sp.]|nr:hypothetical protein [Flavitalea sp.]
MDSKAEASSALSARAGHVVRISVPVNVANDFTLFTNMLKDLGGRLGCKQCISGAACFFDLEKDYVVNEKGQILNR